ncbi:hypothetical protein AT15_06960 [Kosmotoga arenicorallina S304]|uniref:tRNA(Ile)-lysidine synthase n=1 Tax=Kosmotoga arenicorallina S304 TaxID=1453497 RepID=A0A182C701_9BACT|nr:tRNA lysidine(34) synthetase TilS [Kosmotoga arenicorallina]OAA31231.1 hypothetical protein AT15_06960 [Kosmotoga arenicorallina S304]
MASAFEEKVLEFIKTYELIKPGEKILIAVSGGKDSMALLHFLGANSTLLKCEIVAANLDHGLRGYEGQREAEMVKAFCEKRKIAFYHEKTDVKKFISENKGLSPEEAARLKRMEFLKRAKMILQADKIAIAHHLNDLAETILMRLIRGTGLRGMLGMKPIDGDIIRPFLFIPVHDIKDYVTINMVPYNSDKTNIIEDYDRNFIRHRIMPLLKELNPSYEEAFWRFFLNVSESYSSLEKDITRLLELTFWKNGKALIERKALTSSEWAIVAEYVRAIVQRLSEKGYPPTRERVMAFKRLLISSTGGWKIQFADGVECVSRGKYIVFNKVSLAGNIWSKVIETLPVDIETETGKIVISVVKNIPEDIDGGYKAVCPADIISFPLWLRSASESDKFMPFGLNSMKNVISLAAREAPPDVLAGLMVLEDNEKRILWVPGVRASELCRSSNKRSELLLFKFERRSTRGT